MRPILKKLAGTDRRSTGRSDEVVAEVLADPTLFDAVFEGMLADDIVKTFSMQALADIAEQDADLRPSILMQLQELTRTGSPAMQSRGRKLLARLARMFGT